MSDRNAKNLDIIEYNGSNMRGILDNFNNVAAGSGWIGMFLAHDGNPPEESAEKKKKPLAISEERKAKIEKLQTLLGRGLQSKTELATPFYNPEGEPEDEKERAERNKCWAFWVRVFSGPFRHYLKMVRPGDVFALVHDVIMEKLMHQTPTESLVNRQVFHCQYLLRGESFLDFYSRVQRLKSEINATATEDPLQDKDVRAVFMRGIAHHAWWTGEDPRPKLTPTKFYPLVKLLQTEETALQKKYTLSELETRLIREDAELYDIPTTVPQQEQNATVSAFSAAPAVKLKMYDEQCWWYLQPRGCFKGDKCRFHHVKGDLPPGIRAATKPPPRRKPVEQQQ